MKTIKIALVLLILISSILIAGCTKETPELEHSSASFASNVDIDRSSCEIEDYNNGVLYFECRELIFARGLSEYRKSNPDVKVISIEGVPAGSTHNRVKGYFVIVEKNQS